jgi:hypothetical protein
MMTFLLMVRLIPGASEQGGGPGPTVAESIYPIVLRRRRRR